MARAIAATPILEGRFAKQFEGYLESAKPDPRKTERAEHAREVYIQMQARAVELAKRVR